MKLSSRYTLAALLLVVVLLPGCAWLSAKTEEPPAEQLAKQGLEYYNTGKYYRAKETFKIIKERFPFSRFSLLAELKAADCEYYMDNFPEAVEMYKEFEKNHPSNEAVPYVLFQIGRSHYAQIDTVDRDTTQASEAIKDLGRLVRTFPKSSYTTEANVLSERARAFLAGHELYVAEFYFRTKKYLPAKGRAEFLLANYADTPKAAAAQDLLSKIAALPAEELARKERKLFDLY
ncbi:MAG: outer membrane protein assembly factor BamD [Desulfobulbaceae bacterium]|nr:outer membrane protein assembly factor BamD [Desulfobulbaceae bacterium]